MQVKATASELSWHCSGQRRSATVANCASLESVGVNGGEADDEGLGREVSEEEHNALTDAAAQLHRDAQRSGSESQLDTVTTPIVESNNVLLRQFTVAEKVIFEPINGDEDAMEAEAEPDEAAIIVPLSPSAGNAMDEPSEACCLWSIAEDSPRMPTDGTADPPASSSASSVGSSQSVYDNLPAEPALASWLLADSADAALAAGLQDRWSQVLDCVQRELESLIDYEPEDCSHRAVQIAKQILQLLVSGTNSRFKFVTMVTLAKAGSPESRFHQLCRSAADNSRDFSRVAACRGRAVCALVSCHFFRLD